MSKKITDDRFSRVITINDDKVELLEVLGCICCGSIHNLIPYTIDGFYSAIVHLSYYKPLKKFKIHSDFIPVCLRCSIEFQRWIFFYSNFIRAKLFGGFFYILSVIGILTLISNHLLQIISITIITAYFLSFNFHLSKKIKYMEYNPNDYIDISKKKVFLKHQGTKTWLKYEEWFKETIYHRLYIKEGSDIPKIRYQCSDFINCCFCGAKVLKNDIKCVKCEQFLPLVR